MTEVPVPQKLDNQGQFSACLEQARQKNSVRQKVFHETLDLVGEPLIADLVSR